MGDHSGALEKALTCLDETPDLARLIRSAVALAIKEHVTLLEKDKLSLTDQLGRAADRAKADQQHIQDQTGQMKQGMEEIHRLHQEAAQAREAQAACSAELQSLREQVQSLRQQNEVTHQRRPSCSPPRA